MFKVPKQESTAEFKELAVTRVRSGQGIAVVARDLGLVEQTLRNWAKAVKAGKLTVKYAWTDTQRKNFPLSAMCTTLAVSISGYRAWSG